MMKYSITQLNQNVKEPITIEEAKLYLRLDSDYEAANLAQIIKSSREAAEQYLRCSLVEKEFLLIACGDISKEFILPYGLVRNIKSIILEKEPGNEQVLDPKLYSLNDDVINFKIYIDVAKIKITYVSGCEEISASIKQGMLIHLVSLFESRGGDVAMPIAVRALYQPHRKIML